MSRFLPLIVTIALLAACVQPPKPEPRTITAVIVVLDLSSSSTSHDRCDELAARARQALEARGVRRLDFAVLGTGDGETSFEPIPLVPWTRFEPSADLYEVPGRAEAARAAWVESIRTTCRSAIRTTQVSPIYAAIRRATESLRAHCDEIANRRERCERRLLFIHSDLRENIDRAIHEHLVAGAEHRKAKSALPRFDVGGVELAICGVAQTRMDGERGYIPADVLSQVWSQVIGPSIPAFDASCPVERPKLPPTPSDSSVGR